ncbi:hypothetical protein, partial [Streptomyces sp. UNOC14_S4]|uniref:hypothetical protein n=1 Tax=Streptomyces sp. UNOC14_S4 TaxID=2872340 RepID=UPI001E4F3938
SVLRGDLLVELLRLDPGEGDRERLALAGIEAEKLDQEITAEYGAAHTHTINVRELRGWLAYLAGHRADAARWYLHTTGLQTEVWGAGHALTQASAQRAAHIWTSVTDPREALALGAELEAVLAATTGQDSRATRRVRADIRRIRAAAAGTP